jgi:copper resistance protein D
VNEFAAPNAWDLASLFCKLSVYGGMASIAGASLFLVLYSDNRRQTVMPVLYYGLFGALLGFQGAAFNFPVQIGSINSSGLAGMMDWSMGKILLDTQLGDVTLYRLLGFAAAAAVCSYYLAKTSRLNQAPRALFFRPMFSANALVLMVLALSFPLTGHVSVLSDWFRFSLALHVIAFAFWIGLLWPFMVLAKTPELELMQTKLRAFGKHAIGLLLVLVLAGAVMLWQLLGSISELYNSSYGLAMSLKVLTFIGIFSLAAYHKLRLVPGLAKDGGAAKFRKSVGIELALALLVLLFTSYLSTLVGPPGH